jgi:hypothetical protein
LKTGTAGRTKARHLGAGVVPIDVLPSRFSSSSFSSTSSNKAPRALALRKKNQTSVPTYYQINLASIHIKVALERVYNLLGTGATRFVDLAGVLLGETTAGFCSFVSWQTFKFLFT